MGGRGAGCGGGWHGRRRGDNPPERPCNDGVNHEQTTHEQTPATPHSPNPSSSTFCRDLRLVLHCVNAMQYEAAHAPTPHSAARYAVAFLNAPATTMGRSLCAIASVPQPMPHSRPVRTQGISKYLPKASTGPAGGDSGMSRGDDARWRADLLMWDRASGRGLPFRSRLVAVSGVARRVVVAVGLRNRELG